MVASLLGNTCTRVFYFPFQTLESVLLLFFFHSQVLTRKFLNETYRISSIMPLHPLKGELREPLHTTLLHLPSTELLQGVGIGGGYIPKGQNLIFALEDDQ